MTALQVIIKEAKAIRSKNPKMEWKKAVAQASAIYASKHKGKSPVGKKHAVKKKAAKKKVVKKVGVIKKKATRKSATKKAKKKISEQSILNRIHKVKQGVEKLDEAQHKHMSGVGASSYALYNNVSDHIDKAKKHIIMAENHIFRLKQYGASPIAKKSIKMWKEYIKEQKTHIAQLKKHI